MATLLIGYDVEQIKERGDETKLFLKAAPKLHKELGVPATFFVCGKTLEENRKDFQRVKHQCGTLIDFQQHTYSHIFIKTVFQEDVVYSPETEEKIVIQRGASKEKIYEEISKTSELLKKYLGVDCSGLTAPTGCSMGLIDRPDILRVLSESGIKFIRSFRLIRDDFPTPFEIQPFWYEAQGFPEILEFPIQGFIDCAWKNTYGYGKTREYLNLVKKEIDYISENNLSWSYAQHDWSSIREDAEMDITRAIIEYALKRGIEIISYLDYYERMNRKRLKKEKEAKR